MYNPFMADSDEMDNMSEHEGFVKKCPRCTVGVIAFDGDTVGSWGECHNEECHKKQENYGYEVIALQSQKKDSSFQCAMMNPASTGMK